MKKLIRFGLFLLYGFFLFLENASAQNTNEPRVYYVADLKSSKLKNFTQLNNIIQIQYLVDGKYLGKKNDFSFSKAELRKELERAFPNPSTSGYAYLDIEDPYMEMIMNLNVNSQKFQKAQKLYLDVLNYVKQLRPNVKWGYYGIPFTTYWGRDKAFYNKNHKISKILSQVDVLYPSLYIFYNNANFSLDNFDYLKENTEEALKLADKYKKDVFPFVMSRYHPSNKEKRFKQIDTNDFSDYLSTILKPVSNGKSINGIVLWNVDNYFYSVSEPAIIDDFKKSSVKNFDLFYEDYLINQFQLINKEIRNIYGK